MASGRIRGITIEIGGDTTKLQSSLSAVDKSLKQTQNNLKDVNKLLKLDPGNTELLTQKQKNLKEAIGLTKERLQQLKEAQKGVQEGTAEWDSLQREIVDTEQNLKGLQDDYKAFGSVAAQAMRVVGDKVKEAGAKVSEFGEKLLPVSAAAGAFGGAMVKLGYDAVTNADELMTLSKQTGISTTELQKMKYAADLVDVSVEDITGALKKMKPKMTDGNETFEKLGVSIKRSDGSLRDATAVFYDAIGALSKIENETERDQVAMELFGKSADSLAGIIDDGGAALKQFGQEAEDMGLILDEDTLTSLNETNDTIDKLKGQLAGTMAQIGAGVAEVLAPALEKAAEWIGMVTEKLRSLSPEQTEMILKIAGIVAAVAPLIIVIGKVITGIGTLISALSFFATPAGLVVLAIAAIVAAGVLLYKNWDKICEWAKKLKETIVNAWNNTKEKVSKTITDLKEGIASKWNSIKEKVSSTVSDIKSNVSEKWESIKSTVSEKAEDIKTKVSDAWSTAKETISSKLQDTKEMVQDKLADIKAAYDEHGGGIEGAAAAAIEGVKQYFSLGYDAINELTGGRLDDVKQAFTDKFETIKEKVSSAIDFIKGLFNFQWDLPDIKLPHFSWDWTDLGFGISIPNLSIEWYKKAYNTPYLFTNPTVIGGRGFGDGGGSGEMVYGRDQLLRDIAEASQGDITINVYANEGMDVNQLAKTVEQKLAFAQRQRAAVYA